MPSKRPDQRLRDIIENSGLTAEFTAGMSYDQYLADARTRLAVERGLSIIPRPLASWERKQKSAALREEIATLRAACERQLKP
jgi:hypothetical protein